MNAQKMMIMLVVLGAAVLGLMVYTQDRATEESAAEPAAEAQEAAVTQAAQGPVARITEEELADGTGPQLDIDEDRPNDKTAREQRKELRTQNKTKSEILARLSGLAHSKVNHRLNQEVRIRKVSEATERELEARARAAERWLDRLQPGRHPA